MCTPSFLDHRHQKPFTPPPHAIRALREGQSWNRYSFFYGAGALVESDDYVAKGSADGYGLPRCCHDYRL